MIGVNIALRLGKWSAREERRRGMKRLIRPEERYFRATLTLPPEVSSDFPA